MIIDLSIPRLFVKDKIDDVIFNAKMRGYNFNKHQIMAASTAVIIILNNNHALACQGTTVLNEGLKQNTYAVVFALTETFKSCTFNDFKNMAIFLKNSLAELK